mgnify:CR=1 FL=1
MHVPPVEGYGDFDIEPFESYEVKWTSNDISGFPSCLVENWVYRHWQEFSCYWLPAGALEWRYELCTFSNKMIGEVCTFPQMMETMKYWGEELFCNRIRKETWLATFMLENGTSPAPILVFEDGEGLIHPRGRAGEKMCAPYQLIEGHMRTAYLWGMQRNSHPALKSEHQVWLAKYAT